MAPSVTTPKMTVLEDGTRHIEPPPLQPWSQEERDYYSILIRALRKQLFLSETNLAREANLRPSNIRKCETGKWLPTPRVAEKLAKPLAVTPQSLYPKHLAALQFGHKVTVYLPEVAFELMDRAIKEGRAYSYSDCVQIALAKLFGREDCITNTRYEMQPSIRMTSRERAKLMRRYRSDSHVLMQKLPPPPKQLRRRYYIKYIRYVRPPVRTLPEEEKQRRREAEEEAIRMIEQDPWITIPQIAKKLQVPQRAVDKWHKFRRRLRELRHKYRRGELEIIAYVRKHPDVSPEQIMDTFGVSKNTFYRMRQLMRVRKELKQRARERKRRARKRKEGNGDCKD